MINAYYYYYNHYCSRCCRLGDLTCPADRRSLCDFTPDVISRLPLSSPPLVRDTVASCIKAASANIAFLGGIFVRCLMRYFTLLKRIWNCTLVNLYVARNSQVLDFVIHYFLQFRPFSLHLFGHVILRSTFLVLSSLCFSRTVCVSFPLLCLNWVCQNHTEATKGNTLWCRQIHGVTFSLIT